MHPPPMDEYDDIKCSNPIYENNDDYVDMKPVANPPEKGTITS